MTKEILIQEYLKIKNQLGHQPSSTDFQKYSSISKRALNKIYPKNGWSALVIECGDTPNKFSLQKSDFNLILEQYGHLVKKLGYLPVQAEWDNAKLKPTVSGIEKSHNLKWSKLKNHFKRFAEGSHEWNDVIALIPETKVKAAPINDECFVYLMKDKSLYKIGISKQAEFREKTLQSEKPTVILIAAKKFINRRIAAAFEKALHESYSHKRKRGGWFILNEEEVLEIKTTLES
jgi:T5orf172 domain